MIFMDIFSMKEWFNRYIEERLTPADRNKWVGYVSIPLRPAQGSLVLRPARLLAYICPQSFSRKISLPHCLGSYRNEPTIPRAELSTAGILRPRGARIYCAFLKFRYFMVTGISLQSQCCRWLQLM